MLNTRLSNLASAAGDDAETSDNARETEENPVGDTEFGFEGDNAPTQIIERNDWTEHQRRRLRDFAQELAGLSNIKDDSKLASAELILDDWLSTGFNPVVFCRYIATANYVSERLAPALKKKFQSSTFRSSPANCPTSCASSALRKWAARLGAFSSPPTA